MNRYEPHTPRAAFGIAAAVLTAITLGMLVVAPATLDSRDDAALVLARFNARDAAPVEVAIVPTRIEVVGFRTGAPTRTLDVTTAGMKMTAVGFISTGDGGHPAEAQTAGAVVPNVAWDVAGSGKPDCKPAS